MDATLARARAGRGAGRQDREVVVITGGSAGLGRAIARAYARRGARIGLIARGRERLDAACDDVRALGGEAIALPADVADADAIEGAAARVEEQFGPIDIWVNNAMASVFAPAHRITAAEFKRVTEVTYLGVVHGTHAALRRMRPRDRGVIVQVGSALAYRGIPLQSAYCAAKHAIQGFCDSLRAELLHDGSRVRVAAVHMPALNTPQFIWSRSRMSRRAQPVPPIYDPDVGAQAVLLAADARRREVWVAWSATLAILSARLTPGLGDRYLAHHGVDAQLTDEPEDPERCDNLMAPCDGQWAAQGPFTGRARHVSSQLWLSAHRRWLGAGAVLTGILALLNARKR